MRKRLLILLCCACSLPCFAQAPTEKTLLWRIAGNGLSHPSYLYGTMHLTDDRLFNFGDSLLAAIEKSEGFAMEIDPDEMMTVVMEQMFNDIKKARLLQDVVSKKAFAKYAPLLSKRIKKEQEELTVKDVLQEQNKWMQDAYNKGTMPTFVDTWLYDIARKLGKWVGGIEDVQDQTGLMEDLFNEQDLEFLTADYTDIGKKYLNNMIETYEKQDIEGIEAISNEGDSHRKDLLLLHRNVKMARRMDSLSAIRTMVFAVGAAHLPGDSGVISLLRKKGFEVKPVFSAKKIAAKNYKVESKPVAWQKIVDSKGLYEVEMPGKASPLKMFGVLEMRLNINLFTSSGYLTMALPSSVSMQNPDSVLLLMARSMMQDKKLKQGKPIAKNGIEGREYVSKTGTEFKRCQIFSSGQTLYVATAFFNKEAGLTGADATHFFESLVLHPMDVKPSNWVPYTGLLPRVHGEAPVALEINTQMAGQAKEEGWETKLFTGLDPATGGLYMLISRSTTNDLYIPNDSSYLSLIRTNFKGRVDKFEKDTMEFKNGLYCLEQTGINKTQNIHLYNKTLMKANTSFSFFAIVPDGEENKKNAQQAVDGFWLHDPAPSIWQTQSAPNGYFSTWAPANIVRYVKDSTDEKESITNAFNIRDTNTSFVYSIFSVPFDSSTWYNGQQDYWDKKLNSYTTNEDTLVNQSAFTSNGLSGYDIAVQNRGSSKKTKLMRLFTYGDSLYVMFTYVPSEDTGNVNIRRFFTDIKITKPAPPATVFTSKAQQLVGRLYNADSATHTVAYNKLSSAPFTTKDIPLLREAMMEHFAWDSTYEYYTPVQIKLGEELVGVKDSTLADFIKSRYDNRNGRDDEEQTALLNFLLTNRNAANMRFVVNALKDIDGNSKINERALYRLDDSLESVKPILSDALSLLEKKNMAAILTGFVKKMLDSNLLQTSEVLPYETALLNFGKSKLQEVNAEEEGYGWELEEIAIIAGRLKTPACLGLLKQMLGSKHNAAKMEGVYGMLEAGQPLPENVITAIAGDRTLRSELLEGFTKKGKEALFPKAFKTQQWLGESNLYSFVLDEDGTAEKITFLSTQKTTLNGKPVVVYFYKVSFSEDGEKRANLGAIAFPADPKILEPIPYSSALLWDDVYDIKSQEKQIKQLLKTVKENTAE